MTGGETVSGTARMEGPAPVSVIIPTYNRRHLVGRAIDSVLAQTVPAAEIIVVDDGSTDGTAAWLAERYGGRIVLVSQTNQGVSAARNVGLERACFDLIAFLDSDDFWVPGKLAKQVPAMADSRVVLSATNWHWRNGRASNWLTKLGYPNQLEPWLANEPMTLLCSRLGHGILLPTCITRREIISGFGGFDTRRRIAEDMDMIFRLADEGAFSLLSEVLYVRESDESDTGLTNPASTAWRRENLDNHIDILRGRLATPRSPRCARRLKSRLVQILSYRAKLYAKSGEYDDARRLCTEALSYPVATKDALYCTIGAIAPPALKILKT